jgi:preprotein translocase subunit SecA
MSNVAALLVGRSDNVGDGVYLERTDPKELALEEYLRGVVARAPRLYPLSARRRKFLAAAAALEPALQALDDKALVAGFRSDCARMQRAGFGDALIARAFAAVREASRRSLGMRPFDVQLLGGWTLLQGRIAEMATGEGKTLVATLPACTAAATGAAVHVVTVNDYLAERDAEKNMPLYRFMGMSVGVVKQDMPLPERRAQYSREVVYVSNKELVFDYLKDRIAAGDTVDAHLRLRRLYKPARQPSLLLRGLHFAIVDEADSVLIDEARTPLIISETRPDELGEPLYKQALELAKRLRAEHYEISRNREVWITPAGEAALAEWSAQLDGVWKSSLWRMELVQKALSAVYCFHRDQNYIVADNKVQIVDEFTGRVMPDRSWEQGLHQMIEAKEGAEITGQRKTLSRLTYQRFFRRYLVFGGMTGTAAEIAPELRRVYDLDVVRIPTNKPLRRRRLADSCWATPEARWNAVADRAIEIAKAGRAVLIGSRSVEASEHIGALLAARGAEHTVLNARQDKAEADAVAIAGHAGRITVATNMAGRGTDIQPEPAVLERGGLHVILTEFHESARIDRQLFGRSGRQGQPGTVEGIVSLEDELFRRFAPALRALCVKAVSKDGKLPSWLLRLLVWRVQDRAERYNRGIRLQTMKQDKKLQTALGFAGVKR